MSNIRLKASDGEIFSPNVNFSALSVTIQNLVDCFTDENVVIPLPNVNSSVLSLILKWSSSLAQNMDTQASHSSLWVKKFSKLKMETLLGLVAAANYLHIKDLIDITTKSVANAINNKPPEVLRRDLGYPSKLAATHMEKHKEEEQIKMENKWWIDEN